ncbi:kelch-like ECH-associated protein 1 [Bactrocera tryoni]|uniref:kelch-like ECH-associated protein 1 n=1 Tax=Bactrocera tryoni TaxID=59916 RepID=UPI001A99C4B3|nr:kelch-like ECH-associated protein 1 [Bactrocera tryoni]
MLFTKPRGVSVTNCGEKTILALCSEQNPKLLQYNKTEDKWEEYASIKIDYELYRTILKDDHLLFIGGWETRSRHCVVELDDKIYAIGGCDGNKDLSSVEIYRWRILFFIASRYTTSDGWVFVTSLIVGRNNAGAATSNGKIYAMGGYNNNGGLKSVECYNPDSNTWTSCADMTKCHSLPCVAAHKGRIYVLSRRGAERYDPQLDTWSQICFLEVGPGWMSCVSLDNKLWALGGKSKSADKSCVSVFDEENSCWVESCSLPESIVRNCFVVPESLLSSM